MIRLDAAPAPVRPVTVEFADAPDPVRTLQFLRDLIARATAAREARKKPVAKASVAA